MATAITTQKLNDLIGVDDMTLSEVKLVIKYWEDCPRRLHGNVIRSIRNLEKIPSQVQMDLIDLSARATRAIGELLCVNAQNMILEEEDFEADIPLVVRKANTFAEISESLWKHLAACAKKGELSALQTRRLAQRKDCPTLFAKAAGYTPATFAKAQVKTGTVKPVRKSEKPVKKTVAIERPAVKPAKAPLVKPAKAVISGSTAKTVKTRHVKDDENFADPKKVASHVRNVRRPK